MLLKKGFIVAVVDKIADLLEFKPGNLIINESIEPPIKIVRKGETLTNKSGWNRLHLHLFVKEDICEGDWILGAEESKLLIITASKDIPDQLKLIATTNSEYPCARIPKWFVQEYAEKETSEVLVRYEKTDEKLVPKKNKEHYIQLGALKDSYTVDDVKDFILKMFEDTYGSEADSTPVKDWIGENLY